VWLTIQRPGVFYGQCSELCGANHAFMPIVVEAVTPRQVRGTGWRRCVSGEPVTCQTVGESFLVRQLVPCVSVHAAAVLSLPLLLQFVTNYLKKWME
jgi:hypothetical protein